MLSLANSQVIRVKAFIVQEPLIGNMLHVSYLKFDEVERNVHFA